MGGRVAEELIFGYEKVTAGAASDIEQATKIARHMVTQWGMSDKLRPMSYGENQQEVFLGHSVTQTKSVSESTAQLIDAEIRRLVEAGFDTAKTIIAENLERLHDLANALLEHETMTGEEVGAVLRGEPMPKSPPHEPPSAAAPSGGKRGSVPTTAPPKNGTSGLAPSPPTGRLVRSRLRRAGTPRQARIALGSGSVPVALRSTHPRVYPTARHPARRPRFACDRGRLGAADRRSGGCLHRARHLLRTSGRIEHRTLPVPELAGWAGRQGAIEAARSSAS